MPIYHYQVKKFAEFERKKKRRSFPPLDIGRSDDEIARLMTTLDRNNIEAGRRAKYYNDSSPINDAIERWKREDPAAFKY